MAVRQLSPSLLKKAQDELGEVPARVPEDIKAIKEWLVEQPHINANLDNQWILAFLRGCKFDLELTKERLDNFYTGKALASEISMPADPADEKFLELFRLGICVPLKHPISEDGVVVLIYRPGVVDYTKHSVADTLQLQYMLYEMLIMECDNASVAGTKLLSDLKNISMKFIAEISPALWSKMDICGEKSLPVRFKGGHHINTPVGIETFFNILAQFMSEKLKSRIFVHNQNYEELYKYIPKNCLPTEYGGNAGPISDLIDYWETKLLAYRETFLESRKYKNDESKRPGGPRSLEISGFDESFRSLNFD